MGTNILFISAALGEIIAVCVCVVEKYQAIVLWATTFEASNNRARERERNKKRKERKNRKQKNQERGFSPLQCI